MPGNLITAPAEFDVTFDFAIYLCSQNYNRKIERSKKSPKILFADGNLLYFFFQNLSCFHVVNFIADGKIFYSRSIFPENVLLLFLKRVYQYLFTFASIFVLHKAG